MQRSAAVHLVDRSGKGTASAVPHRNAEILALASEVSLGFSVEIYDTAVLEVDRNFHHAHLNRAHHKIHFVVNPQLAHKIKFVRVHGLRTHTQS